MSGIIDQQVYTYSRVPSVGVYLLINNPRPPWLLIFLFYSTQDIFIPTSPIIKFQSFLLSINSHFHQSPS